jgi:predicted ferric reductase
LRGIEVSRIAGYAVIVLVAMMHILIVLGAGPWWVRAFSALAVACYAVAGLLLRTRPVRAYLEETR